MGRLGIAVDGVGTNQCASWLYRLVAAIRRARRAVPSKRRSIVLQLGFRRTIPGLGVAHPVRPQHHHGRNRLVYPSWHFRDARFLAHPRGSASSARTVTRGVKAPAQEVILTALARMGEQAPGFVYTAYIFTFGTTVLAVSRDFLLTALIVCTGLGALWAPVAAHFSDRIGRRRMYMIGATFSGLFGFVYFALLETRSPVLIFIAIALSLIPILTLYGPQAALIAESFEPRLRYSGAGIGYQLASIIAGGPAPFIAAALFAAYQSGYAIAFYILGCGVISIIAAILLKDHTNKDIDEYDVSPL